MAGSGARNMKTRGSGSQGVSLHFAEGEDRPKPLSVSEW